MQIDDALLEHHAVLFALAYFGAIAVVAAWEELAPPRSPIAPLRGRWAANFALTLLNTALIRWLLPLTAVAAAGLVSDRGWGLLEALEIRGWLALPLGFLLLDLSRYVQHTLLHRVPVLWRCHRTHHTDQDYDFTTGLRFHPLDAFFTHALSLLAIALLGPPVLAVALYETAYVIAAMFVHGNVRVPERVDRLLRLVLVTPDMHRVHHSADARELDANYGAVWPFCPFLAGGSGAVSRRPARARPP